MKKLFSFVCALVCAMSLSAKTVYLDVSPIDWDGSNAKIAAWVWTGDGQGSWAGGTFLSKNADGYYTAEVGENTKVIFLRLNKDITDISKGWDNVWNRTNNLDIPAVGKNVFKLTTWKVSNDNSNSDGYWLNYEPLVYTVVGAEAILGSAWSTTDTNNDMAKQDDGTYKLEKTDVALSEGDYGYKVVIYHSFDTKLMDNQTLTISKAGIHTLTFTYDPSTKAVNATATLTKEEVVVPAMRIAGSFFGRVDGSWAIKDLTPAEDKSNASIKVTMEAGTYEFKVIKDGSWLGNNGTMVRSNCTNWNFYGDAGNAKLNADAKGDYTFTWTYETNALSVTFPAATATDLIGADSDSKAVKIVRDGQLLIVRDGVTYNMMGSVVK